MSLLIGDFEPRLQAFDGLEYIVAKAVRFVALALIELCGDIEVKKEVLIAVGRVGPLCHRIESCE
jgi:hypothetical protein